MKSSDTSSLHATSAIDWDDVLKQVESATNIECETVGQWVALASSLQRLAEEGAPDHVCWDIFHAISQHSPHYKGEANCQKLWNKIEKNGKAGPGVFINMFKAAGCEFKILDNAAIAQTSKRQGSASQASEPYVEPEGQFERTTSPRELKHSILLHYLRDVMWGSEQYHLIMKVWQEYHTGFDTKTNRELFRYYDINGDLRNVKTMKYRWGTHHRDRARDPCLYGGTTGCFYGEHLLRLEGNIGKPVCIVESEKTALVMAILNPGAVWLATGSCENLSTLGSRPALINRDVTICPDLDQLQAWRKIALRGIEAYGKKWHTAGESIPGYTGLLLEAGGEKADLADYFLNKFEQRKESTTMRTARDMAKEVPGMWRLMVDFECEVVGAGDTSDDRTRDTATS